MNPTTPPFDSEWLNHRHAGRHGHALKKMRCRRDSRQEEGHVEGKREKAAGGEVMSGGGRSWQVERDAAKYARKDSECGGEKNSREKYF